MQSEKYFTDYSEEKIMSNVSTPRQTNQIENILNALERLMQKNNPLDDDTPYAKMATDYFTNDWIHTRGGLLAKTNKIRVEPEASPAPRIFHFHIFRPYKRKEGLLEPVELVPGPIRGTIYYRHDLFQPGDNTPVVAVSLQDRGFFHPNFSRRYGLLCLGDLPPGPIALEHLLTHLYCILCYQNLRVSDPADAEAATYFGSDPEAMSGLGKVEPLY
jgi:hypothetical protein